MNNRNKDIFKVELGPLILEAINQHVFPSDPIKAAFKVIQSFRNRLHPGNELKQTYKLTPRTATTIKIILDSALIEWEKLAAKDLTALS